MKVSFLSNCMFCYYFKCFFISTGNSSLEGSPGMFKVSILKNRPVLILYMIIEKILILLMKGLRHKLKKFYSIKRQNLKVVFLPALKKIEI